MMWPFRKPKEVRAALATLEIEAEQYRENSAAMFGIDHVSREVRQEIETKKDTVIKLIGKDGMTPRALVHMVIGHVVYYRLTYGKLHVHRGILRKEGYDLLSLFRFSSQVLVEEGTKTQAESDADISDLERDLKEIG